MRALTTLLAVGLLACGRTHLAAHPPAISPGAAPQLQAASPEPPAALAPFAALLAQPGAQLPEGVSRVDELTPGQRVPQRAVAVAVESLPEQLVPSPLLPSARPEQLPPSAIPARVSVQKTEDDDLGPFGPRRDDLLVVLIEPYGRVTALDSFPHASDNKARLLLDQAREDLAPARSETIGLSAEGTVEYRITDAWIDPRTRVVAAVRETLVQPKLLLGGLMLGFWKGCKHCASGTLTLLMPGLEWGGQREAVGDAEVALAFDDDTFSTVRIRFERGAAASFSHRVPAKHLARWLRALGQPVPAVPHDLILGADVVHDSLGPAPSVLVRATFVPPRRS